MKQKQFSFTLTDDLHDKLVYLGEVADDSATGVIRALINKEYEANVEKFQMNADFLEWIRVNKA